MKKLLITFLVCFIYLTSANAGSLYIADSDANADSMLKIDFDEDNVYVSICKANMTLEDDCESEGSITKIALKEITDAKRKGSNIGRTMAATGVASFIYAFVSPVSTGDTSLVAEVSSLACSYLGLIVWESLGDTSTINNELREALNSSDKCEISHQFQSVGSYNDFSRHLISLVHQ